MDAAPTSSTHSTLFGQFYTWVGTRTFFKWPSPVTESVGAVVLFLVYISALHGAKAALAFLLGTIGQLIGLTAVNVIYMFFIDPNKLKGELVDFPVREVVLVLLVFGVKALFGI